MGTSFMDRLGDSYFRWIGDIFLFLYLFLNKKFLIFINPWFIFFLFIYLAWCLLTTSWSEVPFLSFVKSSSFIFNVIVMLSIGSLWVFKFGYKCSLNWLFFVLVATLLSGMLGEGTNNLTKIDSGVIDLYSGLTGSANQMGFLSGITASFVLLKLYFNKENKLMFSSWFIIFIVLLYYLLGTYSRSAMAIFICAAGFFFISLPLSKKILIGVTSFFCLLLFLVMTPANYLENLFFMHIVKFGGVADSATSMTNQMLSSRALVWQKSYQQALKGGLVGGGFAVTIGEDDFSKKHIASGAEYGREKGNAQYAIMEETGVLGLVLYSIILITFFSCVIPYYLQLKGSNRVVMGVVLGLIIGLLVESIVEAWWDSAAAPEMILFWLLVGVTFGMTHLQKRKLCESKI